MVIPMQNQWDMDEELKKKLLDPAWLGPRIKGFRERKFKKASQLKAAPYRLTSIDNVEGSLTGPSWEFIVRLVSACGSTLHELMDELPNVTVILHVKGSDYQKEIWITRQMFWKDLAKNIVNQIGDWVKVNQSRLQP
jgi:hypothetical protein